MGISRRVQITAGALALLTLVAVSGCSGSHKGTQQGSETTRNGPVKDGGTLTFGQTTGVSELDPNTIANAAQAQLQTLLWDGLTQWAPDNMSVKPDLAKSWQHSADYKQWTFSLRSGVTYHNGKAFTATDAVKNINRVLDPAVPAQVRAKIDMISSVQATDPTTLTINLKTPNPQLPLALIDVKMSDVDDIANINKDANGTGPYKLKSFVPNQTVDIVRNDHYWGTKPHFDEIKVVRYADATAAESAIKSGDLDILASAPPDSLGDLAKGRQLLEAAQPASAAVWELDTTSAPFDNPKARQALSYATDRKSMIDAAYAGHGVPNPGNVIINPKSSFYDKAIPNNSYDLNKAKKLFAEAGVKQGDTLTFWTTAGSYPEWTTMAEILQQSLKKIGIDLKIQSNEVSTWSAKFYPKGKKYPGMIAANYLSFPPLPATYSLSWFATSGTCECNWAPPAGYDQANTALNSTDDPSQIKTAANTMQKLLNEQAPIIVIGNSSILSIAQSKVRGVWVQSEGTLHLENAGFAA